VITVTANGRPVQLGDGATLADLVAALDLEGRVAAAEHNGVAVCRADHAATALSDGDHIELVRVMAGG
jgi:sulfur carrier protein